MSWNSTFIRKIDRRPGIRERFQALHGLPGRSVTWLVLFACLLSLLAPQASAKMSIDIYAEGFRQLPLALVSVKPADTLPPCSEPKLQASLEEVIQQDLETSGYFRILPSGAYLQERDSIKLYPEKIDYRAWSLIGAEGLILLEIRCEGEEVACQAQLLDVFAGKLLVWKRYRGKVASYRQVAHRFANEVVKELTGDPAAFDTRIAYVGNETGSKEIYVMDYDGNGSKRLTNQRSIALSPAWAQDARSIVFTSYMRSRPGLYLLDLDSSARSKRLLPGFSPLCSGASFSRDGKKIAFSASLDGNTEIFSIPKEADKAPERLTKCWSIDVSPSWSPDGSQVVFVSDRAGRPDLYVLRVDSGKVRRLTFEGAYNADPNWSPKGDWIVYVSQEAGRFQVHRIRPDGSESTRLTEGPGDHGSPAFSPDGRLVVFSSNEGGSYDLYLMRLDGSGKKRITWGRGDKSDPAWSPTPDASQ